MKFLVDKGFDKELVEKLNEKYDTTIIATMNINKNKVIAIIDYFKEIGIKPIDDLLLARPEIFLNDLEFIKKIFAINNLEETVNKINEDITYIDKI